MLEKESSHCLFISDVIPEVAKFTDPHTGFDVELSSLSSESQHGSINILSKDATFDNTISTSQEVVMDVSTPLQTDPVTESVHYTGLKEASIVSRLIFDTPPSPDGRVISVYESCYSGQCDCVHMLDGVPSQLKPCRFATLMFQDGLFVKACYERLFYRLVDGFPVVDSEVEPYCCDNYKSIMDPVAKSKMDKIIASEMDEDMVSLVNYQPACVHALGAVPKPDGNIRPITDCSRPIDVSVNFHCASLVERFHFQSIDTVVSLLDQNDFMGVVDIKAAYRAISIRPDHRKFVGFRWEINGELCNLVDNRLCFGLRTGPCYFDSISCFLEDYLREQYSLKIVNYLDDYLCIHNSFNTCQDAQNQIVKILRFVGFYVSWNKLKPPAQIQTYLGIVVDSVLMELCLPEGKLEKVNDMLLKHRNATFISKKDLEVVTGMLAHCATIVKGGRVFTRRVYDLCKVVHLKQLKRVRIPEIARQDLQWWYQFVRIFNGKGAILLDWYEFPMYSDASLRGFGAVLQSDWFAGTWNESEITPSNDFCHHLVSGPQSEKYDHTNINVSELWPVLVGLKRWFKLYYGQEFVLCIG